MDNKPIVTISILAKYYYHHCGYRKKKIAELLLEFLSKYYPRYELNEFNWKNSIEKIASNAGTYPLYQISGVRITKSEIKTISCIHNNVLERLVFTMLCIAKLNNIKNPSNSGWVNIGSKELFTCARISCPVSERDVKIGKLWDMGLLEFSKRNDNLNCRVTFIDNEDDEELFISDFRELGYEYLNYYGGNFVRCRECGILIKNNKNGTKKYCKKCSNYTPRKIKKVVCVDCGKEFEIDSMNNSSSRCRDCYIQYRRKYKSQKELERYYKNREL